MAEGYASLRRDYRILASYLLGSAEDLELVIDARVVYIRPRSNMTKFIMFGYSAWNELVGLKDRINSDFKLFWRILVTSGEDCYINIEYNKDRRICYTVSGVPFEEMHYIEGDVCYLRSGCTF